VLRSRLEAAVRGAVRVNANELTVSQLVALFMEHGTCDFAARRGTTEAGNYHDATRELVMLYGELDVGAFGVLQLKALRKLMIENGLCRSTINKQRIRRIRTIFRWATEHHQLDALIIKRLESVKALRPGVDGVRESKRPLAPMLDQIVAVLTDPKCPRVNRDMLRFQSLTGARPGEICTARGDEIDQATDEWIWQPQAHKNAWREKPRIIPIGPRAQLAIVSYLNDGFLFLTKRGKPFRVDHYHQMIDESCDRRRVPRFSPQSVRRLTLNQAYELADLETAQEVASHADARTTEQYLRRSGRRARKWAREHG
jgi:integrase